VRLHAHRWGSGPTVVLVHGILLGGRVAWRAQRRLTRRWTLVAVNRPGHGDSPEARQDFETEAPLVADQLLDEPVHLVGHSYGAIVAMLAAIHRPEMVRSLTVIEPPSTKVLEGDPVVDAWAAEAPPVFSDRGDDLPALVGRFYALARIDLPVPDPLPAPIEQGARALAGAREPGEAVVPLDELAGTGIPLLAVSGDHYYCYEAICDEIARVTGGERAVIPGAGHLVQDVGAPFNETLEEFLLRCD
jgi:pimeloyl-ACP methyl ester carboxylesterase